MTCATCHATLSRRQHRYCSRRCSAAALTCDAQVRAKLSAAMSRRMKSPAFRNELIMARLDNCPLDLRPVRNKARKHFGAAAANAMIRAHLAAENRRARA